MNITKITNLNTKEIFQKLPPDHSIGLISQHISNAGRPAIHNLNVYQHLKFSCSLTSASHGAQGSIWRSTLAILALLSDLSAFPALLVLSQVQACSSRVINVCSQSDFIQCNICLECNVAMRGNLGSMHNGHGKLPETTGKSSWKDYVDCEIWGVGFSCHSTGSSGGSIS